MENRQGKLINRRFYRLAPPTCAYSPSGGLMTDRYWRDDGEQLFHCLSPYKELGTVANPLGLGPKNNLAYYVDGNTDCINQMKLVLNVHQRHEAKRVHQALVRAANVLTQQALNTPLPKVAEQAIAAGKPWRSMVKAATLELTRDDRPTGKGYEPDFLIRPAGQMPCPPPSKNSSPCGLRAGDRRDRRAPGHPPRHGAVPSASPATARADPASAAGRFLSESAGAGACLCRGSTVNRLPYIVDHLRADLQAVVTAALQPVLARLEALGTGLARPHTGDRPPSTVHPDTWELKQLKHSVRWTVYVPQAIRDELQRRAAARGQNPSLLVQVAPAR